MPDVTQLEFTTQPSDTEVDATIVPAVRVELKDEAGDTVVTATNAITIGIEDNPGGGTLSGTLTKNAVAGVAIFNDLSIDQPGVDYTLRATAELGAASPPGASLWVTGDAPTLEGLNDGDKVGFDPAWIDRITGVRQFTSSSDPSGATLRDGGPNGLRYLEFRGAQKFAFSNTASTVLSTSGYAIFIVARIQQPGHAACDWSGAVLYNFAGANGFGDISLCLSGGQNKFRLNHYIGGGVTVSVVSTTSYVEDEWYIIAAFYDGSDIYLSVNNETPVTAPAASLANDSLTPAINTSDHLDADIEEILEYKGFPGTDVIDESWAFLAERTTII
jgi:hypothetical protein